MSFWKLNGFVPKSDGLRNCNNGAALAHGRKTVKQAGVKAARP